MNRLSALAAPLVLMTLTALTEASCGGHVERAEAMGSQGGAAGAPSSTGNQGGAAGAASSTAGAPPSAGNGQAGAGGAGGCAGIIECAGHVYYCGDGLDNDGDGLVDADDPECYGPCKNSENTLDISIPGQSDPGCTVDCYFDNDSGAGNDDCYWSHRCDPNEVAPDYYPEPWAGSACEYDPNATIPGSSNTCAELHDMQSPVCHSVCDPLAPNGCDCFGCCELPAHSNHYVWLGSMDPNLAASCTLDAAFDEGKCYPCEPVPGCINRCDPCELCLGKPTVQASCDPLSQCPPGVPPCGLPGQPCCPQGLYCITGCCQPVPL